MRNFYISLIALMAGFVSPSEACTASAVPASPASASRTPVSQSGAISWSTVISIDCTSGETYTISPTASNYTGLIGSTTYYAQVIFYKDAALTQPLFTNKITGTAATTGTLSFTVYGLVKGTAGVFQGMGSYNIPTIINVVSSGGATFQINYTESGTVVGTCTIGNASTNFNNVQAGQKPINPFVIGVTCTANLPFTISQASAGSVSIGATTTNTAWIFSDASGTTPLSTTPSAGTGTGGVQNKTFYLGLRGPTMADAIAGAGTITGSAILTVTY